MPALRSRKAEGDDDSDKDKGSSDALKGSSAPSVRFLPVVVAAMVLSAILVCSVLLYFTVNPMGGPPSSLQIEIQFRPEECTRTAEQGNSVSVHYTGRLWQGDVFDSSVKRGTPFKFTLGKQQVIQGWDEGVLGMCIGEKRRLVIPPSMGYGERGAGKKIPPYSTLDFEVELLDITQ